MEMGEWTVFFIQYTTSANRWVTKSKAHATLEQAWSAAMNLRQTEGLQQDQVRIVCQITKNEVL